MTRGALYTLLLLARRRIRSIKGKELMRRFSHPPDIGFLAQQGSRRLMGGIGFGSASSWIFRSSLTRMCTNLITIHNEVHENCYVMGIDRGPSIVSAENFSITSVRLTVSKPRVFWHMVNGKQAEAPHIPFIGIYHLVSIKSRDHHRFIRIFGFTAYHPRFFGENRG